MYRSFSLGIAGFTFVFAATASAASPWDLLLKDFPSVDSHMQFDATLDAWDIDEEWFTSQTDVFPQVGGQSSSAPLLPGFGDVLTISYGATLVRYEDVPLTEWFAPYVRDVLEQGIMSGYRDEAGNVLGKYGPADNVTIEQLAKIAVEIGNVDSATCTGDLLNASAKDRWSELFIHCAEAKSWAVYSDGSVNLTRPATRAEVVVTILQAFGVTPNERKGTVFTDVTTSTEFGAAIETAAADFIVGGYNDANGEPTGLFGPADPVRRAEIAKIVSLALQVYGE